MLDSLARFIAAAAVSWRSAPSSLRGGAVGGSVANHLDYGADDGHDSVKADDLLQARGFRDASVIVLLIARGGGPSGGALAE